MSTDRQVVERDDVAVLVAGVRLYDALYHADIEWLKALPDDVMDAYGEMQTAVDRLNSAEAEALREAARFFEDEFADAWGGDLPWITTGKRVADLVAGILRDHAGITDPSP